MTQPKLSRAAIVAVVVAALGYFVDIYDLILFSVVRVKSLQSLGVPEEELRHIGASLLNWQMFGMLVGGLLWGILGDRRGRISILFGSILLYSAANVLNAFVENVSGDGALATLLRGLGCPMALDQYLVLRFVAGVGLAGELGAGVTLVSELLGARARGYGTTIVATFGICGAVLAVLVAHQFEWRTAYLVGGGMGLVLLVLRLGVAESGMFRQVLQSTASRGNVLMLFSPPRRAIRYLSVIVLAIPIWFVVAIPVTHAPEFGKALGVEEALQGGIAVLWCYIGLAAGDLSSGLLSQALHSRKAAILSFHAITAGSVAACFWLTHATGSATVFYATCFAMGFGAGYWAVFVTTAAEQFGTNLRATAATSAPNFVRGSVPLLTTSWLALSGMGMSIVMAASIVGAVALTLAVLALLGIEETYGKDLDFTESHLS